LSLGDFVMLCMMRFCFVLPDHKYLLLLDSDYYGNGLV